MKSLATILVFLLLFIFSTKPQPGIPVVTPPPVETEATAAPTLPPETQIADIHSPLYLEGVPVKDVVQYFSEVCLSAEFVNSGDPSFLQRWETPIRYSILGSPTEEDLATLESFCQWLNGIEGFPGIGECAADEASNLRIHFVSQEELLSIMGDNFVNTDGAVTFWYENNAIYDGIICIRNDVDQQLRNSVILEELYNCLGPIQDTDLRTDSIIYSGFSQPQALTDMDKLILRLLYHPALQCGMDSSTCQQIIEELYY